MDARDANERLDELYAKVIGQYDSRKTISERLTELEKSQATTGQIKDLQKQIDDLKNGKEDKKGETPWWKQPPTATGMVANAAFQWFRAAVEAVDGNLAGINASVSGASVAVSGIAISTGILSVTGFGFEKSFAGTKAGADAVDTRLHTAEESIDLITKGLNATYNQNMTAIQTTVNTLLKDDKVLSLNLGRLEINS